MKNNKTKIQNKKNTKQLSQKETQQSWKDEIYHCPYLIAIIITSLAVMIGSDEIGMKAIAREAESAVLQTMGKSVLAREYASDVTTDAVINNEEVLEKTDESEFEEIENAGECKEDIDDEIDENKSDNIDDEVENTENTEEIVRGITKFESYEPQETDSIYYSDAGKIAFTTEYPYAKEDDSYFNDAAFLGDSRTLGISDYAGLEEADFYCDSGMTIFKLLGDDGVTNQRTGNKENLVEKLQQKQYGKIYIMLGMNELGYGNTGMYLQKYQEVVDQIREWQPEAIFYIMANLHVSREKNNLETEFNNININDKNVAAAGLANGTDIFYLDANPLFTDEEGYLNSELSFDGVHLYAQHYDAWKEFLLEHAVEPVPKQEVIEVPDVTDGSNIDGDTGEEEP